MNFEEYIKNETKSLNLKFLSEETRNFIPAISGNFIEDKKIFSNFWNKVKLEKVSLKKEKKITKINIKEINTFCNITKKIFLNKYSALIYREITDDLKTFIRVEELCSKASTVVDNLLPSFEDLKKENKLFLKDKETQNFIKLIPWILIVVLFVGLLQMLLETFCHNQTRCFGSVQDLDWLF